MKALIQRVSEARVDINGNAFSKIGRGVLIFHGVEKGDTENDLDYLVHKVSNLRIFEDEQKKTAAKVPTDRQEHDQDHRGRV